MTTLQPKASKQNIVEISGPRIKLSRLVGSHLVDSQGDKLGKVKDIVVRPGGETHPPIAGIVGQIGHRELFIPIERVREIKESRVELARDSVNLKQFERRPGELLLARDVAGRHLIHLSKARLLKARDIEMGHYGQGYVLLGAEPVASSPIGYLYRKLTKRKRTGNTLIDWSDVEPFVGHVPTARLRLPYRALARLRPAQIADLVEAASHEEGEEIIEAVGHDRDLEADVFEELDPEHQREFMESKSEIEAARVLSRMAPDDAADLIADLDQDQRLPLLEALPADQRDKVRNLLHYHPETAGGLMNPDFLQAKAHDTVGTVLDMIRNSDLSPEVLSYVYIADEDGILTGMLPLVSVLQAEQESLLGDSSEQEPVTILPDGDVGMILHTMSDFNLQALPVVDESQKLIGVVTFDDVLELLLNSASLRRNLGLPAADDH
ncbi:MAG: CBS domain-containing protein [Firmicutes bacterium]|nr:CBS domain-containing protein [Bacillota bacterium]